jgi:hypothetical protein
MICSALALAVAEYGQLVWQQGHTVSLFDTFWWLMLL